jgi:hypothetical protein
MIGFLERYNKINIYVSDDMKETMQELLFNGTTSNGRSVKWPKDE